MGTTTQIVIGSLMVLAGLAWFYYWLARVGPGLMERGVLDLVKAMCLRIAAPIALMVGGGVWAMLGGLWPGLALFAGGVIADLALDRGRVGMPAPDPVATDARVAPGAGE